MCSAQLIFNTLHFSRLKQWWRNPFKVSVLGSYLPCRLLLTCYKSLTLPLGELLSWQGWVTTHLTSHITCHITHGTERGPHIRSWPVSTGNWGARAATLAQQLTRPQHNNTNSRWYNESTDRLGLIFYFDQHTENTDHHQASEHHIDPIQSAHECQFLRPDLSKL